MAEIDIMGDENDITEREKLVFNFYGAMPLINELVALDRKFIRYYKIKDILSKIIVFVVAVIIFAFVLFLKDYDEGKGGVLFVIILAITIWLFDVNKKKFNKNEAKMRGILSSEELSFIPESHRNTYDIVNIYQIAVEKETDTLEDAIYLWEQKKSYIGTPIK